MTSRYPNAIDGYSEIRIVRDRIEEIVARDHNDSRSAIIAIEQTLGINPQGVFGTVADRLDFQDGYVVPASGDLSGTYPSPTVVGIYGKAVSSISPLDGYIFVYNGSLAQWEAQDNIEATQTIPDNLKTRSYPFKSQLLSAPTVISLSGVSAKNVTPLSPGNYILKSTVNCYVLQGGGSISATTSNYPMGAAEESRLFVVTDASDGYFAGITDGSPGFMFIKEAEEQ